MTEVSSTWAVQASRGDPRPTGASDLAGSSASHNACRVDRQPVRTPCRYGELANAATSTAPSRCASCQRRPYPSGPGSSSPASTQTWTEAEVHIMARPALPERSSAASMAAYRGSWSSLRGGCRGSTPRPTGSSPDRSRTARTAARSAATASTQAVRDPAGRELSSSCPPGSNVRAESSGVARTASAAAVRRSWETATSGRSRSWMSHSSSTPTVRGGPVLKHMPRSRSSASFSPRGSASTAGPRAPGVSRGMLGPPLRVRPYHPNP